MQEFKIQGFTENKREKEMTREILMGGGAIFIMGTSKDGYSKELSEVLKIDGYIDDFTTETLYLDKPIYKSSEIPLDAYVIVCSTIRPLTAVNVLRSYGLTNILHYPIFYKYANDKRLKLKILGDFEEHFTPNIARYEELYNALKDAKSKKILLDLLSYRLSFDLQFMRDYKLDVKGQYFEDFLNLKEGEVFADVGGFDGGTSIEFIGHCPQYRAIYIFEPTPSNLAIARKNLKNYKNIHFIEKGLGDQKATLRFDVASSASKINESGTTKIKVDTLDNLVNEKLSFIKMDIEGSEIPALCGAREHILNDHPKLAISVYHKIDDLLTIKDLVLSIRDDYDLYLRHYTEGTDESVMFFIPR